MRRKFDIIINNLKALLVIKEYVCKRNATFGATVIIVFDATTNNLT